MNSFCDINALNDDCLVEVFKYLSFRQKVAVQRVCQRWQDVSQDMLASVELTIFYDPYLITNWASTGEMFMSAETVYFNEQALDFNHWLKSFLAKFWGLKRLVVKSEKAGLKCSVLARLVKSFPELISLKIVDTTLEPDKDLGWARLRRLGRHLEAVGFEGHRQPQFLQAVRKLIKGGVHLEDISIRRHFGKRITQVLKGMPNLKKLNVQVKYLSQLKRIIQNKAKLRDLAVAFSLRRVNLFDLLDSLDTCPALRILRLETFGLFEPKGFNVLFKKGYKTFPGIRQLELSNFILNSQVMLNIDKKLPAVGSLKLKSFQLLSSYEWDAELFFKAVSQFSQLQKLSLNTKDDLMFSDRVLYDFFSNSLPNLRHFAFKCFEKKYCMSTFSWFASQSPHRYFKLNPEITCQDPLFQEWGTSIDSSKIALLYDCACGNFSCQKPANI